ncbi:MAG: hypothetical protein V3R96_06535 [Dehalococcoidales bacterium]
MSDIHTWLNLSHEWDGLVNKLISDISAFYEGFDDYMTAKIAQNEAYLVEDGVSGRCLGVVAFSKKTTEYLILEFQK